MDETAIVRALTDQWPTVGVLLILGWKALRSAAVHVIKIGDEIAALRRDQHEGQKKTHELLESAIAAQKTRSDRHSQELRILTGRFEALQAGIDAAAESTSSARRASGGHRGR